MDENLIKKYRKRAGLSQKEVASALHVTQGAVSSWESGRWDPDQQNLSKMADLFGVSVDTLLGRNVPIEPQASQIEPQPELVFEDEVMLPLVASLRCGPGDPGKPFSFIKPVPAPKSYIRRWGEGLQVIMAVGESMSPTIIPGDMLVCRPGDAWENGQVVSVNYGDTDMVKRIYRTSDGGIDLRSDNPKFETIHVSPEELRDGNLHVLGRVLIPIPQAL
ncbi:MAG: helix-turn-helix domain-containing protein [Anaerolineaceae bacterium]|nr:helix-turn-helix domain-containing protein [Anaerolineaceae bacterium]